MPFCGEATSDAVDEVRQCVNSRKDGGMLVIWSRVQIINLRHRLWIGTPRHNRPNGGTVRWRFTPVAKVSASIAAPVHQGSPPQMYQQLRLAVLAGCFFASTASAAPPASTPSIQRIVVIRHGEKPDAGLGQLNCRGLSRALALPDVIIPKYGMPQALFAPNPAHRKPDRGKSYNYVRPLATVEPLAIRAGLPVEVKYGFEQAVPMARALDAPQYATALVVVAWEHHLVVPLMQDILKRHGGDPKLVELWKDDDFDRMDLIEVTRVAGRKPTATYAHGQQGLNGISGECPRVKLP